MVNFEKIDPTDPVHEQAATIVSEWTRTNASMAFYALTDILAHSCGILAFAEETREVVGHIAVTSLEKEIAKIGAFTVAQEYQGKGVGNKLVRQAVQEIRETFFEIESTFAYVNKNSQDAFLANGFEVVGERQPPTPTGCNTIVSLAMSAQ